MRDARRRIFDAIAIALAPIKNVCIAVPRRFGESPFAMRLERAARHLLARVIANVRRRSLIAEILALQFAVAVVVGLLALGGLWWASSVAVQDHMRTWGAQWLGNLDQLAS